MPQAIKICTKCNKEAGVDNVYCPYDGTLLTFKEIQNMCTECGKQYDNTYIFCPIHGNH